MKQFYGQKKEDRLIWNVFKDCKNGYFAEMGASDGIRLSNSYIFELIGWRGLCIEPLPKFYEKLVTNRPNSTCVFGAVGNDEGEITLHTHETDYISTTELDASIKMRNDTKRQSGIVESEYTSITVPLYKLQDLLDKDNAPLEPEFISIDVEGAEIKVLEGMNLNKYKPKILILEANNAEQEKVLTDFLKPFGYFKSRKTKVNILYCRDAEIDEKLLRG